ncbi:MAG TPA: Ig-like domain-containing protein [Vulgatibacter sp.]
MERATFFSRLGPFLVLAPLIACSSPAEKEPEGPPGSLSIRFASAEAIHTAGVARIEVIAEGKPDSVSLMRDGSRWIDLESAAFEWDTEGEAERVFLVSAMARRGDEVASSETLQVTVDRTAPTLADRIPRPGSQLPIGNFDIVATFGEPIVAETIDDDSVRLYRGDALVPTMRMLASDRKRLTVIATTKLVAGGYRLELSDAITDLAGNRLVPAAWSWTANDGQDRIELEAVGEHEHFLLTNADEVEFRVAYEGTPDQVELLLSGETWNTMRGKTFKWDVTHVPDGAYVFTARAFYGPIRLTSLPSTVFVDHGRPEVISQLPDFIRGVDAAKLPFEFNEPVDPATVGPSSVRVLSKRGEATGVKATASSNPGQIFVQLQGISAPDRIEVELTDGIRDLAGNPLRPHAIRAIVSDWTAIGGPLTTARSGGAYPTVASRPGGRPVVAWVDEKGLRVRRWGGASWASFPEPADGSNAILYGPAVAVGTEDHPVVVWTERPDSPAGAATRLRVSRWDGSSWRRLGEQSLNLQPGCDARDPAIAVGDDGNPVVVWGEQLTCNPGRDGGGERIVAMRWTGSVWDALGGGEIAADAIRGMPSVALDRSRAPIVAWTRGVDEEIGLRRWDRGEWVAIDPDADVVPGDGVAVSRAKVAVDSSGRIVLAWAESVGDLGDGIRVRRQAGVDWDELGGAPVASRRPRWVGAVSLALDPAGEPVVAWGEVDRDDDGDIFVSRWNGSAWSPVGAGETFNRPFGHDGMALAMDAARPVVALSQEDWTLHLRSPE